VPEINLKSLESAILEGQQMWVKSQDQAKQSRSHQRSSHFSPQNYTAGNDISFK
jgi:hypothetical protein